MSRTQTTTTKNSNDDFLRKQFDDLDIGGTGKISAIDFKFLVFGNDSFHGFRKATIDAYISELTHDSGWITFEQFKKFMQAETQTFDNPLVIAELRQAFNEVDINKDGFISPHEAQKGIILAGERISGASFQHLAQHFDDNKDGQMSLEEFINNIKKFV